MSTKRYGYVVTEIDGDGGPTNLQVGAVLLEKRGRGDATCWDFLNMETGEFTYVYGRKIGTGHVGPDGKKFDWDGGTPPEAQVKKP